MVCHPHPWSVTLTHGLAPLPMVCHPHPLGNFLLMAILSTPGKTHAALMLSHTSLFSSRVSDRCWLWKIYPRAIEHVFSKRLFFFFTPFHLSVLNSFLNFILVTPPFFLRKVLPEKPRTNTLSFLKMIWLLCQSQLVKKPFLKRT